MPWKENETIYLEPNSVQTYLLCAYVRRINNIFSNLPFIVSYRWFWLYLLRFWDVSKIWKKTNTYLASKALRKHVWVFSGSFGLSNPCCLCTLCLYRPLSFIDVFCYVCLTGDLDNWSYQWETEGFWSFETTVTQKACILTAA